jgi:hypothetical protein
MSFALRRTRSQEYTLWDRSPEGHKGPALPQPSVALIRLGLSFKCPVADEGLHNVMRHFYLCISSSSFQWGMRFYSKHMVNHHHILADYTATQLFPVALVENLPSADYSLHVTVDLNVLLKDFSYSTTLVSHSTSGENLAYSQLHSLLNSGTVASGMTGKSWLTSISATGSTSDQNSWLSFWMFFLSGAFNALDNSGLSVRKSILTAALADPASRSSDIIGGFNAKLGDLNGGADGAVMPLLPQATAHNFYFTALSQLLLTFRGYINGTEGSFGSDPLLGASKLKLLNGDALAFLFSCNSKTALIVVHHDFDYAFSEAGLLAAVVALEVEELRLATAAEVAATAASVAAAVEEAAAVAAAAVESAAVAVLAVVDANILAASTAYESIAAAAAAAAATAAAVVQAGILAATTQAVADAIAAAGAAAALVSDTAAQDAAIVAANAALTAATAAAAAAEIASTAASAAASTAAEAASAAALIAANAAAAAALTAADAAAAAAVTAFDAAMAANAP